MKKFCILLLFIFNCSSFADEWYNVPTLPDDDWDRLTWLSSDTNCEIVASKVDLAIRELKTNHFKSINEVQVKDYVGENCKLTKGKVYVLARGLYFCCNGSFGVAKIDNSIFVAYSGLGKTPKYKRSAVVIALTELPNDVYTGVFVTE